MFRERRNNLSPVNIPVFIKRVYQHDSTSSMESRIYARHDSEFTKSVELGVKVKINKDKMQAPLH